MKHFITIADASIDELEHLLDVSVRLKKQYKETGRNDAILAGKTLAMIFEKPSLRTRVSFEVGIHEHGGEAVGGRGPAEVALQEVGAGPERPGPVRIELPRPATFPGS